MYMSTRRPIYLLTYLYIHIDQCRYTSIYIYIYIYIISPVCILRMTDMLADRQIAIYIDKNIQAADLIRVNLSVYP